jgi:cysteinyl-tRNA synthetase
MELKLYDTLTREKRVFEPLDRNRVRMYVCGPTVYDFAHIGNARPVIVFDVLFRLLRHLYGAEHVVYVRNITDVDDKINARAAERGVPIRDLTEETYRNFKEDVAALGCLPPTVEPRATEHITEMKTLIERLVAAGNAYVAEGHVLFHVPSMPDYGKLSKRSLDELIAGARVDVAPYKRDPMDFVLWKPSKPGEPAWPSPAGIAEPGRPGWHIECSAMAWKHLGETFDIHGGGIDLVFPHHENEIAQSRCAFHTPLMARTWMHNGFLQVEGEKMAKSEDNFITIRELREGWGGRRWDQSEIRLMMLSTHYRQPIDWTLHGLSEAGRISLEWKNLISNVDYDRVEIAPSEDLLGALCDDVNSPAAIQSLHETAKRAMKEPSFADRLYSDLVFLGLLADQQAVAKAGVEKINLQFKNRVELFADPVIIESSIKSYVFNLEPAANTAVLASSIASNFPAFQRGDQPSFIGMWTRYGPPFISPVDAKYIEDTIGIEALNDRIEQRLAARSRRDFQTSDGIRDELSSKGIELGDKKDGTPVWKVRR